jgi:hypothetical protein
MGAPTGVFFVAVVLETTMKRIAVIIFCLALGATRADAQVLYSSDLADGTGWSIVDNDDTSYEFGWDYSALGLPPAPHGSDTIGLRLASNISDAGPGAAAISASPPATFSGQYKVQFDFWLNYHTSAGTTEYGGGMVGLDVAADQPLGGKAFLVDTDGDTAQDYVLMDAGNIVPVNTDPGPNPYTITSLDHVDPSNEPLRTMFPGHAPPEKQNTDFGQVLAANPDGTFGFGWHTMEIVADTDAGTATFSIDGFEFGTLNGDVSGPIALTHWDRFNSVAGNVNLAFGAFDNLVVTQIPEPTSALLALLGLLGLGTLRRTTATPGRHE